MCFEMDPFPPVVAPTALPPPADEVEQAIAADIDGAGEVSPSQMSPSVVDTRAAAANEVDAAQDQVANTAPPARRLSSVTTAAAAVLGGSLPPAVVRAVVMAVLGESAPAAVSPVIPNDAAFPTPTDTTDTTRTTPTPIPSGEEIAAAQGHTISSGAHLQERTQPCAEKHQVPRPSYVVTKMTKPPQPDAGVPSSSTSSSDYASLRPSSGSMNEGAAVPSVRHSPTPQVSLPPSPPTGAALPMVVVGMTGGAHPQVPLAFIPVFHVALPPQQQQQPLYDHAVPYFQEDKCPADPPLLAPCDLSPTMLDVQGFAQRHYTHCNLTSGATQPTVVLSAPWTPAERGGSVAPFPRNIPNFNGPVTLRNMHQTDSVCHAVDIAVGRVPDGVEPVQVALVLARAIHKLTGGGILLSLGVRKGGRSDKKGSMFLVRLLSVAVEAAPEGRAGPGMSRVAESRPGVRFLSADDLHQIVLRLDDKLRLDVPSDQQVFATSNAAAASQHASRLHWSVFSPQQPTNDLTKPFEWLEPSVYAALTGEYPLHALRHPLRLMMLQPRPPVAAPSVCAASPAVYEAPRRPWQQAGQGNSTVHLLRPQHFNGLYIPFATR